MTRLFLITLLLLTGSAFSAVADSGRFLKRPRSLFKTPDCYCTNRGQRIELGDLACLSVDGTTYLAQCQMALNNPMWRKVEDGCPTSRLNSPQQHALNYLAGGIE
ncbi:hypothetical protein [Pseudovibrio sp. Tun.PSC04-5.I4]|uniref:hypothetical protein n=1 Tax=Pseudovibrio sp. Tun.PSC04-5.I4 TaxID=1798213 RepID=UPI000B83B2E6|nr:hypothetical protein [Pseudovibrio sp. Tun.PSC04-5.I4]